MKLPRRRFLYLAAGSAALPVVSRIERAQAQDYPAKPVRIITHSAPGGSPDALLRIVGDRLSQMWGRQIVVLNHPVPAVPSQPAPLRKPLPTATRCTCPPHRPS